MIDSKKEMYHAIRDAERQLLGALLVAGSNGGGDIEQIREIIKPSDFSDADFHDDLHSRIFAAMLSALKADQNSTTEQLYKTGKLRTGDVTYMVGLIADAPGIECLEYAKAVQNLRTSYFNDSPPNGEVSTEVDSYHTTDAGNAEYFTALYGQKLRYDHRRGRWLKWDQIRWHEDSDGRVMRLALAATRNRYQAAVEVQDLEERKKISTWAINSEARAKLEATIAIAKNLQPITDSGENWDIDPWLFCVKNGVIDLRSGELKREGQQDDRITYQAPVVFDPKAKSPRWDSFLGEIFSDDTELIAWLQKFLGYCLTGDTREQVVAIGYGRGANGKSRLLSALRHAFGDYAYDAPFSTFELYDRSSIPNDLAALAGRRFVTSSETNEGTRLNEARVKALSGQDSITARFLHREFFTFQPVAKFFLAVNHRPRIYDDSYGFWRRVRLIPFNREFKGAYDDKQLLAKLTTESSGILNWLLRGCRRWLEEGLDPTPGSIAQATVEYQQDSDPLSQFILDQCAIQSQACVRAGDFYKEYLTWCADQGLREKEKMTSNAFGRRMSQKFRRSHDEGGTLYHGVGLKTDGFLTDSEANKKTNQLIPNSQSHMKDKPEKPSESVSTRKIHQENNVEIPVYPHQYCTVCGSGDYYLSDDNQWLCTKCYPKPKEVTK